MTNSNARKRVPDISGRLYTDNEACGIVGTWVRRAEVDALLDEITQLRGNLNRAEEDLANYALEVERLRGYWTGDKLTGGSDVCHTCHAHCVVLGDKDAEIERKNSLIDAQDAAQTSLHAENVKLRACWSEALANIATRNQEIERLRAALDRITSIDCATANELLMQRIAAQALGDEPPSHEPCEQLDEAHANAIATSVVQNVCELPDYTSPEDRPELLQCTVTELHSCVMQAFEQLEYDREMEVGPPGRCLAAGCAQSPMRAAFCEKHNEAIPLEDREDMIAAQRRALKSSGMSALCSHSHCRNPLPHVTGASCTIAMP